MDASPLRLCECLRAPAGDSPDTIAARKEQRGILRHAFTSLNDKRARVVRMRFEDGMTFQQIGNVLGISETAAFAMHLPRARRAPRSSGATGNPLHPRDSVTH
jgi:RNA polymerase sigma factor (sigma-70 family)